MTDTPALWWHDALSSPPLLWRHGQAYFSEPSEDIAIDNEGGTDRRRWSNMRHHHFDWLETNFKSLSDNSQLIDLGAGPAQFRNLTERFDVCHIDHFPYPLVNIVSDITQPIPLQEGCADGLMLSNVLEHVYEPGRLLAESWRMLRPGGRLFLVVPFMIKEHQGPHDFFRYTRFALDRLARGAGFGEVTIQPLGNLFDIYDIDRWARAQIIRAKTKGLRRFAARGLIKVQNFSEFLLRRALPEDLAADTDDYGFAQSFGMLARK